MKKAWIENDRIRDIATGNPAELYHPDVAKFYDTDVPDDAANGDGWIDGVLVKPVPVEPAPVPEPEKTITAEQVRKALTLGERVKWDNDSAPEIVTVKLEFATPRTVPDATELLDFLVSTGAISQASRDKALA